MIAGVKPKCINYSQVRVSHCLTTTH